MASTFVSAAAQQALQNTAYKNLIMENAIAYGRDPRPAIETAELEEAEAHAKTTNRRIPEVYVSSIICDTSMY